LLKTFASAAKIIFGKGIKLHLYGAQKEKKNI
jgi:hypothetical protein